MGAAASAAGYTPEKAKDASDEEVKTFIAELPLEVKAKVYSAVSAPNVKIHGMPVSQTCVGPILLAMEAGVGGLAMCNLMESENMKPEFLAMNPYHQVPTLEDGAVKIGESVAILRYLAMKYKPELYPVSNPAVTAMIDFAMDAFSNSVYQVRRQPKPTALGASIMMLCTARCWQAHKKSPYVVLGFASPPEDQAAANKAYVDAAEMWCKHFLKGKFVCGDKVSIADYKAIPFFYAAIQPACKIKIGLEMPAAVIKYCEDFKAAVSAASFMDSAGGYSIAEFLKTKEA